MVSRGDYYSLDDILRDEVRVPAQFTIDLPGLSHLLDPTSTEPDVFKDSTIDVPFWMARIVEKKGYAQLKLPPCLNPRVVNALDADATVVRLDPYFYDVGLQMSLILNDASLASVLLKAFAARMGKILDFAHCTTQGKSLRDLKKKLCHAENKLLSIGLHSASHHERWRKRELEQMSSSSLAKKARRA